MDHEKILIVNLGGIGDILLSTPALRALKKRFPATQISMLVPPQLSELVSALPYISRIFIFSKGCSLTGLLKDLYTLLELRRRRFDLLINMRTMTSRKSAQKIKLLVDLIRPKIKAGRDTEGRGWFFELKVPESDEADKYDMEYDLEIVKALGAQTIDRVIDFKIDDASRRKVESLLEQEGVKAVDILVGVHPGGESSRRWPVENFALMIKQIQEKTECKFIITAADNERRLADRLISLLDFRPVNTAGKLNIKELGCLIQRCNLYISNDTGPMHIAAILGVPQVAIFGPGQLTRFDPRNISDKAIVIYHKVDCAPCNKRECVSLACLRAAPVEEVTQAALSLLKKSP